MIMTAAPHHVTRRATIEDLPQLIPLWELEQLPAAELEKRFTEFQVVADDAGQVLAAIGVQISGADGLLHSEAIAKPEFADALRDLLWKRLQVTIRNHALERLWTQLNFPFWRELDFKAATAGQLALIPAQFKSRDGTWDLKLLPAASATAVAEREFARLKLAQQEETARMQERVRWMKRVALGVTVVVFLLVIVWAVTLMKVGPKLFRPH
jgi:N-acetylglutamate synthase-like GNAT family acetyltransferase